MKKITLLIIFIFTFGLSQRVSAHTYSTDGAITVLMHSNPDDDPIAGEPAALLFDVDDKNDKFDPINCNCTVIISTENKEIFNGPALRIDGPSIYGLTLPFTFPQRGIYQIKFSGGPKNSSQFQNFSVNFDLRIDRGTARSNSKLPYIIGGGIILLIGAAYFIKRKFN
jgi:hypothetical protein